MLSTDVVTRLLTTLAHLYNLLAWLKMQNPLSLSLSLLLSSSRWFGVAEELTHWSCGRASVPFCAFCIRCFKYTKTSQPFRLGIERQIEQPALLGAGVALEPESAAERVHQATVSR